MIIDLGNRYSGAFGSLQANVLPRVAQVDSGAVRFHTYNEIDPDFENVRFEWEQKKASFASLPFLINDETTQHDLLAPPPLIHFSQAKHLIETPINGDLGTEVVERWATKEWQIRMRGILVDMGEHHYPTQLIEKLYTFFKYNGVVDAYGTQFYEKDIFNIYLKDIELNGVQGYPDTVQFTITAKSSTPVGFTLNNPNAS